MKVRNNIIIGFIILCTIGVLIGFFVGKSCEKHSVESNAGAKNSASLCTGGTSSNSGELLSGKVIKFTPMINLPDNQQFQGKNGCLKIVSKDYSLKNKLGYGLPYPYHLTYNRVDCGVFENSAGIRGGYCLTAGEKQRNIYKIKLLQKHPKLKVLIAGILNVEVNNVVHCN